MKQYSNEPWKQYSNEPCQNQHPEDTKQRMTACVQAFTQLAGGGNYSIFAGETPDGCPIIGFEIGGKNYGFTVKDAIFLASTMHLALLKTIKMPDTTPEVAQKLREDVNRAIEGLHEAILFVSEQATGTIQ